MLLGGAAKQSRFRKAFLEPAATLPVCKFWARGRGTMSFEVARHDHRNIFVVNGQTYEMCRCAVRDVGALAPAGLR
jgi:hypothetical protein